MPDVELLCQMRKTEKARLVMRRLDMLIVFLNSIHITSAASKFSCDRRTIPSLFRHVFCRLFVRELGVKFVYFVDFLYEG